MSKNRNIVVAVACGLLLVASPVALAEDEGWKDVAELGFVATDGNSESTSFSFKNTLARSWDKSAVLFRAGGIRVETSSTTYSAVAGPPIVVTKTDSTETTAENYYANGRYDRTISKRTFWFGGLGWDRNEFAGIQNRYIAEAGVGNVWFDDDDMKFKTSYGLTFTDQEDVDPAPGVDDTFIGARAAWEYLNHLNDRTTYTNDLVLDLNLDETDDWRGKMDNGLAVSMSDRLALKAGLLLFYDNEPSFLSVPVTGGTPGQATLVQLDELDTQLTISLVINVK